MSEKFSEQPVNECKPQLEEVCQWPISEVQFEISGNTYQGWPQFETKVRASRIRLRGIV